MKAIIIGAGRMAEALLHDLVSFGLFERITLADAALERAKELAVRRGGGITTPLALDAADLEAVKKAVAGHTVCVSAAPYKYNLTLAKAAIAAGCHFTDMGGNNDVVTAELALDAEARAAGVTVVPDMGLAPGMTNVVAAHLVSLLDRCEELHIRVGGLPREPKPPWNYALVFSPYGLINEYAEPCLVLRDREIASVPPLEDVEALTFHPFGMLEAFNTSGGASTLPRTFRGKIRTLDYKTIRYPGHAAAMRPLFQLGLASEEDIDLPAGRVKPRDVFAALLSRTLPEGTDDVTLVRCYARGLKNGQPTTVKAELVAYADHETNLTAMMRTTSFPVGVAAEMLALGRVTRAGVLAPESAFDPGVFLAALNRRGLTVKIITSETGDL